MERDVASCSVELLLMEPLQGSCGFCQSIIFVFDFCYFTAGKSLHCIVYGMTLFVVQSTLCPWLHKCSEKQQSQHADVLKGKEYCCS